MKKNTRQDLINIIILIASFLIVFLAITQFTHLYGSTKDWSQQHWIIPEYFRNLFYETHDLFPDFAFNLGSGQNIYNFSYYGLLSPIIIFSYVLPFVPMDIYMILATVVMLLISVIIMYFFIKKRSNSKIALISSFVFLMATPLIYHSHRHIMFMNYFPFLLMGYIGCEEYFEKKNWALLTLSVFLMIMTSYFFSVGGLLSIVIYGIYCYISTKDEVTVKSFFLDGIKFLIPIVIGIMMSAILTGPTLYSLLNGRSASQGSDILSFFLPDFNLKTLLYSSYTLGLSSLALFSLLFNLFSKKKENFVLTIILLIILTFPIFTYLLNGGLYVDYKALIPLIPLFIILISETLKEIVTGEKRIVNLSMLTILLACLFILLKRSSFNDILLLELGVVILSLTFLSRMKSYKLFYLLYFPVLLLISINFNRGDNLVAINDVDHNFQYVSDVLENDDSFYRINVYDKKLASANRGYDMEYYGTMIYSSSQSMNYDDFYYNRISNEILCRSYRQMINPNNLFYNMYLGNKYVIGKNFDSLPYVLKSDGIYVNEKVLPVGYATRRMMSSNQYDALAYPDNLYAYLNYSIVDEDVADEKFISPFVAENIDYQILSSEVESKRIDDKLEIRSSKNNSKVKVKINDDLRDKVLLISFDMDYQERCEVGDTYIDINGLTNKLTCRGWKYNNKNYTFEYVLSSNDLSTLNLSFSKGKFLLSNFQVYSIDYDDLYRATSGIDQLVIDRQRTKGDEIIGSIDVVDDGYFNLSIPYDQGFTIYVDGEKRSYERVDFDFIGFAIEAGHHDIKITYDSPFKGICVIISIVGSVLFIGEILMIGILNGVGTLVSELKEPKTKMFKFIVGTYQKYREIFNYLVVGVLTTVVSLATKWILLFTILDAAKAVELQIAIIISWICAVLFAYFANRIFVFYSKNKNIIKEMLQFFGARILTLLMEMVIMWFFVTLLKLNTDLWVLIWTIVTQVLIMVMNYVFSKLFVFRKNEE